MEYDKNYAENIQIRSLLCFKYVCKFSIWTKNIPEMCLRLYSCLQLVVVGGRGLDGHYTWWRGVVEYQIVALHLVVVSGNHMAALQKSAFKMLRMDGWFNYA